MLKQQLLMSGLRKLVLGVPLSYINCDVSVTAADADKI